ncbi:MAG TPA: YkgJ family cysteine cluster protein [Pseudomonadales bacterium]|nr:YkgJ family cysteine cluster protein [Pseudomonadales bacterium]
MECRPACGACCIAPSISGPIPGMAAGKPAGVRCIHLAEDLRCGLWGQAERPAVCDRFGARVDHCGDDREDALRLLGELELATRP